MDGGGRVVVATWGFEHGGYDAGIYGRLGLGGYLPFQPTDNTRMDGPYQLVADLPGSPMLEGVTAFSGAPDGARMAVTLAPGATQVAHWNDSWSTPLMATKGRVVGLNFYPVSSALDTTSGWNATTDGATLMANALLNSAFDTGLTLKAPRVVSKGTRIKVSGRLKSAGAVCPPTRTLDVEIGSRAKTKATNDSGASSVKRVVRAN